MALGFRFYAKEGNTTPSSMSYDLLLTCYKAGGRVFECGFPVFTTVALGVIVSCEKVDDETLLEVGRKTEDTC